MPVVAVGLAVALDIGAMGALAAGTLTTLAAVTAIGATMSAVGAVTHNKTLSLIGMGIGVVGAIGTLASGAGVFDNVTDLFSSSSGAATAAGQASLASDAAAMSGEAAAGLPGAIAEAGAAAGAGSAAGAADMVATGAINATSVIPTAAEAVPAGAASAADAASFSAGVSGATPIAGMGAADNALMASGMGPLSTGGSAASDLLGWAAKNPMLSYGILQAGGSFISGLSNPMTQPQIDALNAQANQNNAAAELLKRQTANQSQPIPKATVTGAPVTAGGLINNTPVGTPLITGAPNMGAPVAAQVTGAPITSTGAVA
jgi:hypothetical protein